MQFPAEIDNIKTLKNGMKITIAIEDGNVKEVLQHVYNFIDKPLEIGLEVDAAEREKELNQITGPQRKKIYALFRDIGQELGYNTESMKQEMKNQFCYDNQYEMFSLSNCSKELASDFIEFLIEFAFEYGISLSEDPKEYLDDIERYLAVCLTKKICAICGRKAEVHHWDHIGTGNDRRKYDDSELRKIALCREHHTECHSIGRDSFREKYKVYGIIYNS